MQQMNRREFLAGGAALPAVAAIDAKRLGLAGYPDFVSLEEVPFLEGGGKVWCFSNRGTSQMLSAVFVSPEGRVLVVDGGHYADAGFLKSFLLSIGGRVDYWFITHAHKDHYGALTKMHEGEKSPVLDIGELIWNFPERTWCEKRDSGCARHLKNWYDVFMQGIGRSIRRGGHAPGRKVSFGSWSFEILNDYALFEKAPVNNSSVCVTVRAGGRTWLIAGDLAVDGGDRLVSLLGGRIKHDVVFMTHHGQCGVNRDFYKAVAPKVVVWPTPDWLWDNHLKGEPVGSGLFMTNYTKCWLQELGIKRQYVLSHDVVFT